MNLAYLEDAVRMVTQAQWVLRVPVVQTVERRCTLQLESQASQVDQVQRVLRVILAPLVIVVRKVIAEPQLLVCPVLVDLLVMSVNLDEQALLA